MKPSNLSTLPDPELELLTAGEVAKTLWVGRSTVYEWAREGLLPSIRIGGAVRFRKSAILETLGRLEAKGRPDGELLAGGQEDKERRGVVRPLAGGRAGKR